MSKTGVMLDERQDSNIKIVIRPGHIVKWETLLHYQRYCIALDGYCCDVTKHSNDRLRMNLNHHEGVNNSAVRATCDQIYLLVKQKLFEMWRDEKGPVATLYGNHLCPDICLSTFIPKYSKHVFRPRLRRLVEITDHLDSTGGLYLPDSEEMDIMREQAWIYEPCTEVRVAGMIHSLSGQAMVEIIEGVHERIWLYLRGQGGRKERLDTRFETLAKYDEWSMVREIGNEAKTGVIRAGIRAFVSYLGERNGRHFYSLGRLNGLIPVPVPFICDGLNEAEGIGVNETDRWGGGSNTGGSPRKRGSKMPPNEVAAVVEKRVRRSRSTNRRRLRLS